MGTEPEPNRNRTEPNRNRNQISKEESEKEVWARELKFNSSSSQLNSSSVDWIAHVITKTKSGQCFQNEPINIRQRSPWPSARHQREWQWTWSYEHLTWTSKNPGPSANTKRRKTNKSQDLFYIYYFIVDTIIYFIQLIKTAVSQTHTILYCTVDGSFKVVVYQNVRKRMLPQTIRECIFLKSWLHFKEKRQDTYYFCWRGSRQSIWEWWMIRQWYDSIWFCIK